MLTKCLQKGDKCAVTRPDPQHSLLALRELRPVVRIQHTPWRKIDERRLESLPAQYRHPITGNRLHDANAVTGEADPDSASTVRMS